MSAAFSGWIGDTWKRFFEKAPFHHLTNYWRDAGDSKVPVYVSDVVIQQYGGSKDVPKALLLLTARQQPFIVVNEIFTREDRAHIQAGLEQVYGHVVMHHQLACQCTDLHELTDLLNMTIFEIEADRYAYQRADVLAMLYHFQTKYQLDLQRRITALELHVAELLR